MASLNHLKASAAVPCWDAVLALVWVLQASPLCQEAQRAVGAHVFPTKRRYDEHANRSQCLWNIDVARQ